MDGVLLPQGQSHFDEAVYFLPLSFQKFLVLILPTLEGWKAESTLESPNGFEQRTPRLLIQRLNTEAKSKFMNLFSWTNKITIWFLIIWKNRRQLICLSCPNIRSEIWWKPLSDKIWLILQPNHYKA